MSKVNKPIIPKPEEKPVKKPNPPRPTPRPNLRIDAFPIKKY